MPTLQLSRAEARKGDLPLVCLVCGDAGSIYRNKVLSCCPWWIYLGVPFGLLPYLALALFFDRRALVRAPLCDLHRFHWLWRSAVSIGWLLWGVFLFAAMLIVMTNTWGMGPSPTYSYSDNGWDPRELALLALFVFIGSCVAILLWPFLVLLLKYTGVYATEITTHTITLANVPEEFLESLRVHRHFLRPDPDQAVGDPSED